MAAQTKVPWMNGYYKCFEGKIGYFIEVQDGPPTMAFGSVRILGTLEDGKFDHPDKRGLTKTGKEYYNMKFSPENTLMPSYFFAVTDDGNKITSMNGSIGEWIDEETFQKLKPETDPVDDIPNNYALKPNKVGKLVWISGGTGMGKSTTSLYLKNNFDYVLYEGDAFMMNCNPYVGMAPKGDSAFGTKYLSGIPSERTEVCKKVWDEGYPKVMGGEQCDPSIWVNFYSLMCNEILKERKKLGGNWVINQAVYTRVGRDTIRNKLVPGLRFVQLGMEPQLQAKRLAKRLTEGFGDAGALSGEVSEEAIESTKKDTLKKFTSGIEPVLQDEKNTLALNIMETMSIKDVAETIIEFTG